MLAVTGARELPVRSAEAQQRAQPWDRLSGPFFVREHGVAHRRIVTVGAALPALVAFTYADPFDSVLVYVGGHIAPKGQAFSLR